MLAQAEFRGELHEPAALVTGGASGIGKAVCELLARDGYRVAVADRDEVGARSVADAIGGHAFAVDVADEASVLALFERVSVTFDGALDALATPAGVVDTTPLLELDAATFAQVYAINLIGTFLCIREAGKRMIAGSRICTVASIAGKRGNGRNSPHVGPSRCSRSIVFHDHYPVFGSEVCNVRTPFFGHKGTRRIVIGRHYVEQRRPVFLEGAHKFVGADSFTVKRDPDDSSSGETKEIQATRPAR